MEPQSVPQLATAMRQLRDRGYVRATYTGGRAPTRTLLDALNVSDPPTTDRPDLGIGVMVKTYQAASETPLTLFTAEPAADTGDVTPRELVQTYGTSPEAGDGSDRCLEVVVTRSDTAFTVEVVDGCLYLYTPDGTTYGKYDLQTVTERFLQTYRYLLFVRASKKHRHGDPYFLYEDAQLCLSPDADQWQAYLADGQVEIEVRLAYDAESDTVQNHGTAWRLAPMALADLYQTRADLLDESVGVTEFPSVPQTTLVDPDPHSFTLFAD